MKQYDFNGKKFALKKNTFLSEKKAKEAAGITDQHETDFLKAIQTQKIMLEQLPTISEEKRQDLLDRIDANGLELERLTKETEWNSDIENVKKVFSVILDGDVQILTEEDIGKFDAQEVWQDFFTKPSPNQNDSKESPKK